MLQNSTEKRDLNLGFLTPSGVVLYCVIPHCLVCVWAAYWGSYFKQIDMIVRILLISLLLPTA